MGKNHRHKKQIKSEKAKTKLKNSKTKFLPKGQNVTDLSFKIKPIVISEQLKIKENEVLSSRKLNLKEILNRLSHYNVTVKEENCKQLRELIYLENADVLKQNLSKILKSICPLILDIERRVRREAIKVINEILQVNTSSIISFFGILSSFLRCAMTHINQSVQEDSLLLLDILLLHVPDLVAENSHQILINFFTLISKLKNNAKQTRTLAENLKSKYTGVKWRIEVLIRLQKILEAMFNQHVINHKSPDIHERVIETSKTSFAPIYVDKYENMNYSYNKQLYRFEHILYYVDTLMPLLQETWLEVAPSNITNIIAGKLDYTTLKHESASTLHCTLKIFYLLHQLSSSTNTENNNTLILKFKNEVCPTILNIILLSFPYVTTMEKSHEGVDVISDSKCIEENLLICYLFAAVNKSVKGKELIKHAEKILKYLNYSLSAPLIKKEFIKNKKIKKILLSTIELILERNLNCWKRANLQIDLFIDYVFNYHLGDMTPNDGTELLVLLYNVVDPMSEKQALLAEKSCKFLLKDKISSKVLDFLLLMVKKNITPLKETLRKNLDLILDNMKTIEIVGIDLEILKIVRILSLFHYISLNEDDKKTLRKFGEDNPQYDSVVTSIIDNYI